MQNEKIIKSVRNWVERTVVGLNLCPFAKRELVKNRVRFFVSDAKTEEQLIMDLQAELNLLTHDETIETTLLIHPKVLQDFYLYNHFLSYTQILLTQMELDGIYQIASFHPLYQFRGTQPDDVENFTNRSPYPMLHLIREKSLDRIIANNPETDLIPERNIALLKSLGRNKMLSLLKSCFDDEIK